MILEAETGAGDLPDLLDTLTIAVTTLDAVGVEGYRDLYLYVVGTSDDHHVRDLRVEDGHLIVGPPCSSQAYTLWRDSDLEASRRATLLADLYQIITAWQWPTAEAARYLRCSEAMLARWIGRSNTADTPFLPRPLAERIKRLSMFDQARFLLGISDAELPAWLTMKRTAFGKRSIQEMLLGGDAGDFRQVMMWTLNRTPSTLVH